LILYEYPLNERVRTLLRLEDLFARFERFAGHARADAFEHHAALTTLFEILEVASRADLKSDLLQELERQRQTLIAFRDNPDVSNQTLTRVLENIDQAAQRLNTAAGKTGQHLRDNEWLMSIRSRSMIAGGTCEFDLPSYHAWRCRPDALRAQDIANWAAPFNPLRESLTIVLNLLRDSAQRMVATTRQGCYQQTLGGKAYQMLQIRVTADSGAIPEISANKYMLWIRFTLQDGDLRPRPFEGNVEFELALCNF
jgi:cell division protein ZapD